MAANSICKGSGNSCNAGDADKEDAIEHGRLNSNIGHFACTCAEEALFLCWLSIEGHQERARNVKPLGHSARHRGIEVKCIASQSLNTLTNPLSGKEKDRQK